MEKNTVSKQETTMTEQEADQLLTDICLSASWLVNPKKVQGATIWYVDAYDPTQRRNIQFTRSRDLPEYCEALTRYRKEKQQ